ncbi:hypothetical protein LQ564_14690 [Massilia sp. G4R7]|uniref:Uncharacterized protein n=1 Tax=Massilia phyllostachyos TaxID=2898585 RepID=A0ABS8Q731_9BURK|nr:hypothetical protein [Massilia phyllostachyos]MCD2517558.1 hypothetical protein [Massilia phyllostachyos]
MKISEHIKQSLDAADRGDLDQAMLSACIAIDGTASKMYPREPLVGKRFRRFINEYLDVIELMHGGINLQETVFPFKSNKGVEGLAFADIIYEKFRCNLAHGSELPDGYGVAVQVAPGQMQFVIDLEVGAMTVPQSAIYALGLAAVLAPVNEDQKIGSNLYHYRDSINTYVVDRWWGKLECARQIMDFDSLIRVKLDFSNHMAK